MIEILSEFVPSDIAKIIQKYARNGHYLYSHLRVRNDDHCPICRIVLISIHDSLTEASRSVGDMVYEEEDSASEDEDQDEEKSVICKGPSLLLHKLFEMKDIWIDEWVRRSNGDRYCISTLTDGTQYNLSQMHKYSSEENEKDFRFLLLHTQVREWDCPNNIQFYGSFYEKRSDACKALQKECNLTLEQMTKFEQSESIWLESVDNYDWDEYPEHGIEADSDDAEGDHYQLVPLKIGQEIILNDFCPAIQPQNWKGS